MSAAIKTSLNKLNNAVHKLEVAIEAKKTAPKKGAPVGDLFGAMTAAPSQQTINPNNVRMLATRLDNAINQVEQILKEGRG